MKTEEEKKEAQRIIVLRALQKGERLTAIDALNRFNSWRLSARIYDLRRDGWKIETNIIATKSHKHIAEYSMLPVNRHGEILNQLELALDGK